MKQALQRGFTLIELLVVIAIIGILAAVVLTSLSGAQQSAQDRSIQQTLNSAASAAQIYYNQNNFTYSGMCGELAGAGGVLTELVSNIGFITAIAATNTDQGGTTVWCNSGVDTFVVSAPLASSGEFWCVDETGSGRQQPLALASGATSCANQVSP